MKAYFTEKFARKLEKIERYNPKLNLKVYKTIRLFKNNPQHPSLRLHKIATSDNYSLSVDMSIRIIVNLIKDRAIFLNIGTHDEVY